MSIVTKALDLFIMHGKERAITKLNKKLDNYGYTKDLTQVIETSAWAAAISFLENHSDEELNAICEEYIKSK